MIWLGLYLLIGFFAYILRVSKYGPDEEPLGELAGWLTLWPILLWKGIK